jgi:hypothetical protein
MRICSFPEKVLDMGITERAFPDYNAIGLEDEGKSVKRGHHREGKLRVFLGYESRRKVVPPSNGRES